MNYLSIYVAKLLNSFINIFGLGAGYTWPGHLALKLNKHILKDKNIWPKKGIVFISATNGKTSTTKLLTHILRSQNYSVVTNSSGANLLNGIASALALDTNAFGVAKADYAVFEVDEFTLPALLEFKSPDVLLMLNLSRDQLDRYGEIDTILDRWKTAVTKLPPTTTLIVDKSQSFAEILSALFKGTTLYSTFNNSYADITDVNPKNISAVEQALCALNVEVSDLKTYLSDFVPAWGRGEVIDFKNIKWHVQLAKNPSSFETNLDYLINRTSVADVVLFILNDNVPDGRDVSWIYDIPSQKLQDFCKNKNVFVSGTRAYDMAVRLKYADVLIDASNITFQIEEAVNKILTADIIVNKSVIVLPNYSAMLSFRKIVTGRSIL